MPDETVDAVLANEFIVNVLEEEEKTARVLKSQGLSG